MNVLWRYLFVLLITFVLSMKCFGQGDTEGNSARHRADLVRCGHNYILTVAYHRTNFNVLECSLGRSYSAEWNTFLMETFSQYQIGWETTLDKKEVIFAPKVSAELNAFKVLNLSRLNLLYYFDTKGNGSLKCRHEVGVTYRGFVTFNYQYTFNISGQLHNSDFKHGVSVLFNIPLGKRKQDRIY